MAVVFHRRLALPVWTVALATLVLTTPPPTTLAVMPPTTLFVMAAVGLVAIVLSTLSAIPRLRTSRAGVQVLPSSRLRQSR